jgi:hypothetical protein
MQSDPATLVDLPRGDLHAMAMEKLMEQASQIYNSEALGVVEEIFSKNTAIMGSEQLAYIILRSEAA